MTILPPLLFFVRQVRLATSSARQEASIWRQPLAAAIVAPLDIGEEGIARFAKRMIRVQSSPIDLRVADGLPRRGRMARHAALPRLNTRFAQTFAMLDDADRLSEAVYCPRLREKLPNPAAIPAPFEEGNGGGIPMRDRNA